eukprot:TRINITY_DN371_c0_g1_i15.p1 TRINITY_DN371_c0_g1~~TRINITY_DN371_c0_g1_i15.p1  ORF type:complete len:110 (-),score=20.02 TRINITY_DN371_c0_g1_i15:374-703(-)
MSTLLNPKHSQNISNRKRTTRSKARFQSSSSGTSQKRRNVRIFTASAVPLSTVPSPLTSVSAASAASAASTTSTFSDIEKHSALTTDGVLKKALVSTTVGPNLQFTVLQ